MTTPPPPDGKLLPCPFCGGVPRIYSVKMGGDHVYTHNCEIFKNTFGFTLDQWNRRAPPRRKETMSDIVEIRSMEQAREVLNTPVRPDNPFGFDVRHQAKGYLAGHASRDPEVADVKMQIEEARHEMKKGYIAEMNRMSAELSAEREASRKLVFAAKGLAYGIDWNTGSHAKTYRPLLLEALKFYATPGHSPEGTL